MLHDYVLGGKYGGLFLLFVLVWTLLALNNAAALSQCTWIFSVNEGEFSTNVLQREWDRKACVGEYVTLAAKGPLIPGFTIPDTRLLIVQYAPAMTGLMENDVRYIFQEVSVRCGVFKPLCEKAFVYYVVHGVAKEDFTPNSTTTTTTTTTTTEAPFLLQPTCPASGVIPIVKTNLTVPIFLEPQRYVENCAIPQRLELSNSHNNVNETQKSYFSIDNNVLWFDRKAENKEDGLFHANLTIFCGGVPSCFNVRATVLVEKLVQPPSPAEQLRNCSRVYEFHVNVLQRAHLAIKPHAEDACPIGTNASFALVSPPRKNVEEFRLENHSGLFNYNAPAGTKETTDAFLFSIACTTDGGVTIRPVCIGHARIFIVDTSPSPPLVKEETCPGNFVFKYVKNDEFTGVLNSYSLLMEAKKGNNSSFCPGNAYTDAQLGKKPTYGDLKGFNNKTGEFQYISFGKFVVDYFDFALTCGKKGGVCHATATMQPFKNITPTPSPTTDLPQTVYNLGSIVCKGTCDAAAWRSSPRHPTLFDVTDGPNGGRSHVTSRHDGKSTDAMDFYIGADGASLVFRAYTTIGNIAVRFVTFTPLGNSKSPFLTSEYVPKGANPSFNATCLDKQVNSGIATSIWTWENEDEFSLRGHLNTVSYEYRSGENYFQKFGGKHRNCDVFRRDSCKYAPMLTPSTVNVDNAVKNTRTNTDTAIEWKLYVNDCDATWVGNVSLKALLKLSAGVSDKPLFRRVNGNTLVGTIYSQVVKPASWAPPYDGILSMQREYRVSVSTRNYITTGVEVPPVGFSTFLKSGVMTQEKTKKNMSGVNAGDLPIMTLVSMLNESVQDSFKVSVSVRFAAAVDPSTGERLYGYTLLIYPYRLNYSPLKYGLPKLTPLNTTALRVAETRLLNASWTTPTSRDCPECTGKVGTCTNSETGFKLDCDSIIRLELAENLLLFPRLQLPSDKKDLFFNVSLVARVVGNGTAHSVMESPQGSFALQLRLATSEVIVIHVKQFAYIEAVNSVMHSTLCRSSAYWPVPDPLGHSVPVEPFNVSRMLFDIFNKSRDEGDGGGHKPYYGPPTLVHEKAECKADLEAHRPEPLLLNSTTTTTVYKDDQNLKYFSKLSNLHLSLCASPGEEEYGVTDWVYLSLHKRMKSTEASTSGRMTLEYLILSVDAGEVLGILDYKNLMRNTSKIHFVLDGASLPSETGNGVSEEETPEQQWMGEEAVENKQLYLPWEKYAAYLRYRRIYVCPRSEGNKTAKCVAEFFHFAFIPGALLHSGSSAHVIFHLRASVRVTPAEGDGESHVEKHFFKIPVSAHRPSLLRLDRVVHVPTMSPSRSEGLSKKSSVALFIVLSLIIIAILIAAFCMETHYKGVIARTRRQLQDLEQKLSDKRKANFAEARTLTRDLSPLFNQNGESYANVGVVADKSTGDEVNENHLTTLGIRTDYGVVHLEPFRMHESEEDIEKLDYHV